MPDEAQEARKQRENLGLIEKINSVFLGTRDFKELAERAVNLMGEELRKEGVLGVAVFRLHPQERRLYAYAYASRSFETVLKLFPSKFTELNVPLEETSNLLIKAMNTREPQESDKLYDFSHSALNQLTAEAIQRTIGFSHAICYPLRLKRGKAAGVLLFGLEGKGVTPRQRLLLEAFRSQLELAFENVAEFEQVVERYKRSAAKASPKEHEEDVPTVRFTLRITPKQNAALEKKAQVAGIDKTSLIRDWLDGLAV